MKEGLNQSTIQKDDSHITQARLVIKSSLRYFRSMLQFYFFMKRVISSIIYFELQQPNKGVALLEQAIFKLT